MKVSILIPTHNRADRLSRVLESLELVDRPAGVDVETIVCANACTDDTSRVLEGRAGNQTIGLRIVEEPRAGLSIARNAAMASATGDVFAFLDDDVRVEETWLHGLVAGIDEARADLVAGKATLWWEGREVPEWMSPRCKQLLTRLDLGERIIPVDTASHFVGANFAFRRTIFERIGGFHPYLGRSGKGLLSGEDTEYVRRALGSGAVAVFSPRMAVRHWVAPERVDRGYLRRVAKGRGRTRVALALLAGTYSPARLARFALSQLLVGFSRQLRGTVRGDPAEVMEGVIIRKRGEGTLLGLLSPELRDRFRPRQEAPSGDSN